MIETPTLKTYTYRGYRIYIRKLAVETFEYLISIDKEIFCNQVELARKTGQKMTRYSGEDLEKAISFMKRTAELFIDDKLFQIEEYKRLVNRLKRMTQKGREILEIISKKLQKYG